MAESVITIRVKPGNAAERIKAEMAGRLKCRLDACLETNGGRVLVRTTVESEAGAAEATEIVKDVVPGVRQTLALDALDQGENRISVRVE